MFISQAQVKFHVYIVAVIIVVSIPMINFKVIPVSQV